MTTDVNYILENQKTIEEKISYQFCYHTKLLVQAFTKLHWKVMKT